ncbi:hypothetical protein CVT24_003034 [Panaeolus cyanescens]|uniref:Fe2OG dioxygenase domain-containing protein n=1 Tax=Panaeolus cyanescens TaxID=181874 RepID=A0A409VFQ3_9AGAR|nr:hypothetical protein CVT24_003034 [Panaeolus cyanescens]
MVDEMPAIHPLDIPPTEVDLEYADLPIIDLSLCESHEGRCTLARKIAEALSETGFFYVVNHGTSVEEVRRMFAIADVPFSQVDDEEKALYTGDIKEGGLYRGYKARQAWHVQNGVRDQIEIYNVNRNVNLREHPLALRPYLPQISAFAHHVHENILHQILRLLALGLELPEETFVNIHNFSAEGDSSVRFLKYYPRSEDDEVKSQSVWLKGHTDLGTLTIMYSQPIAALQIVNAGDTLNFLSGGFYQSTIHRVIQPPIDQRNKTRLGLLYSAMADDNVSLAPFVNSPVLQRVGVAEELKKKHHPTMAEWRSAKVTTFGQTQLVQRGDGVEEEVLLGHVVTKYYQ